jgi:hypothetical protein
MAQQIKISRRAVLAAAPAAALLTLPSSAVSAEQNAKPQRKRIAALATELRKLSHAEVILDRILEGFGWEGRHYRPALDLVSLYMDQFPEGDLSRERASRFKDLKIYPTIGQALSCGGSDLAVDGVIIIGEHGNYPRNEKGQWLYPRYEFFQQTVQAFKKHGRVVPVFNDKHLSWNWSWAREMVDTAVAMKIPFMAGSSVPISWRLPSVEMPMGAQVEEVLTVGLGNVDSYDFHSLEAVQSLVERRRGGEHGVARLQALSGERVWKAMDAGSWSAGGWDPELFSACLCRSHQLMPAREGFNHVYPARADLPRMVKEPVAYRYEYCDGLKATMLLLNGLVGDITVAARVKGQAEPLSTLMFLGPTHDTQPHNFDPLVWHIEQFVHSGKSPYPVERTLLTTGLVAAGVDSLARGGEMLETPHLAIQYRVGPASTFRRAEHG